MNKAGRKLMQAINVTGTDNTLSLALELKVGRVIHVSSTLATGATGDHLRDETFNREAPSATFYEQTKSEAHTIAKNYGQRGLPMIIVCPNGVIGPNDHSAFGYFARLYVNKLGSPFGWAPAILSSPVHVEDVAEGIALAAEKGQPGETYLLAGESVTKRQIVEWWAMKPGGAKIRFWLPTWLMSLMVAPLEPLQRRAGLPAFLSRETVRAANIPLNYSSAKAQRDLGWSYRPAQEMWLETIDEELKLLTARKKRDLVSRLKPMEME